MIFNMIGKGGSGESLIISDTIDSNGGIIRTITGKVVKLQTKTITPTSSTQVVNPDDGYDGFSKITVEAGGGGTPTGNINITQAGTIDVTNYATATVPSADVSAVIEDAYYTDSGNRKWTVDYGVVVSDAGWLGGMAVSDNHTWNAVPKNTTITPSTSAQTIGGSNYMMEGAVTVSAMPSGSVTAPASISGSSASVSTGTNTLTLSKTVSVTPNVTTAGYVSSGTAGNSNVSLTASVTTQGAQTLHPSTTDQTITGSKYLTGTQTFKAVTTSNLTADNIKSGVTVKIGDSTDDDCVASITGTYEGSGGGGSGLTVATTTATLSSASTSISFTGLAGEPTSFAVVSAAELATGASPWKTAAVVFDGTSLHGQTIRNTSNAQVTYDGSSFSKTYSNGTLTIIGSGTNFQANQYKLVYTYGGSNIGTADVQVGSGATSITFTNLDDEPSYFSCIFKSNFSTSSGYQRVITVVYDGTNTYGMEMDSSAKYSDAHWSYSYNNGSLTITSSGTNAGGYFHQPGYYQLTYATEGSSGNYQSKTVYATSSQQVITADSAYDALKQVTIPAVTTTNLSASNIINGVTIQVGDSADSDRIASVTGNVVLQNYYTGSSAPSSSTGSNGDLYLQN